MFISRVIPSAVALVALTTLANAADMAVYKAPPPAPEPMATGYVEAYTGWAQTRDVRTFCDPGCAVQDDFRLDGWVLGGAGRGTYFWAPAYSVQLDAQAEGTSYELCCGSTGHFSTFSYLVGGHANWRDPNRGLIGIFAAAGDANNFFTSNNIRHGLIGGEAQWYSGPVTLYGQVGYNSTLGSVTSSIDGLHAWFVRGTGRYFVNPNFKLEGTVLYSDGSYDFNSNSKIGTLDFNTLLWRTKAEYKFAHAPISIFAYYQGSETRSERVNSGSTEKHRFTDDRIVGGVKILLGEKTLQFADRNQTTLDIIDVLGTPTMMFGSREQ